MAKINVRSPYHIYITQANLTSAVLDLYIYTGTQTTSRGAITYSLDSTAYSNKIDFEISELVRDYLDVTFSGSYASQMVWVDYQITRSINSAAIAADTLVALSAFDGYGYFEEGVNPQLSSTDLMQSNTIMYVPTGGDVVVPVNQNDIDNVKFYKGGVIQSTTTIAPIVLTDANEIRYATDADIDEIDVYNGVSTTTIEVVNVDSCKHTPYKITFINKWGVEQDLYFFKRTDKTLTTSSNKYKSNTLIDGTYSVSKHQSRTLNKQGKEKLVLNSGFVDEQMNEVFTQLMLSEKVWILYDAQTLPIEITSSSLGYKTQLNDRLINYTISLDFAFDKINSIR